jgi:hypothetical protein
LKFPLFLGELLGGFLFFLAEHIFGLRVLVCVVICHHHASVFVVRSSRFILIESLKDLLKLHIKALLIRHDIINRLRLVLELKICALLLFLLSLYTLNRVARHQNVRLRHKLSLLLYLLGLAIL